MFEYIFYCRIRLRNAIYRRNIVSRRSAYPHHRDGRSLHRPKRRHDSTNTTGTNIVPQFGRDQYPSGKQPLLLSSRQIEVPYDIVTHDLFGRGSSNGRAKFQHAECIAMLEHER